MKNHLPASLLLAAVALAACQAPSSKPAAGAPLVARFYLETMPGEASCPVHLPQSDVSLNVAVKPVFSEYDIVDAEVARVELGLCVLVKLNPAAARDLYRLSVPAQGRRLAISLNDVFLGVHRIERAMADGMVPIFLEVPDEQLPELVKQLKNTSTDLARVVQKNRKS